MAYWLVHRGFYGRCPIPSNIVAFHLCKIFAIIYHFEATEANITATGSAGRAEPTLSAFKNNSVQVLSDISGGVPGNVAYYNFDASNVILQLGADGSLSSHATRGIMSLQQKSQWAELLPASFYYGSPTFQISDETTAVLDGSFGFNNKTITEDPIPRSNRT